MAARPKKRRVTATAEEEEEAVERRLEELLFGGEEALVERLQLGQQTNIGKSLLDDDSSDSEVENEAKSDFPVSKKAVWVDEEDEAEELVDMTHRFRKGLLKNTTEKALSVGQLQQRLKEQFQAAMGGTPSWAENKEKKRRKDKKNVEDESDEDEDLLQKTGNFVTRSDSLPKGLLQIKHCKDANYTRQSNVKLTASQFHPAAQVIMTAGLDQSIALFQVDEKTNPKIQSIYLERFPVYKARFSADGEQVIATGIRSKMFYVYNMMAGKIIPVYSVRGLEERKVKEFEVSPDGLFLLLLGTSGYLHLLSMKTKELVGSMKINGKAVAATFSPDGSTIYTHSDDGAVYIWDVKSRKCLTRFIDEGCLRGTSIAVSRNGQYVACGSSSGIVNVYSQDTCLHQTKPKPMKVIRNLVTAVTSLAFNPTTEILAIASKSTDHAVKMIHIPSFTAFSNFPVSGQKVIYLAQEMDFSPRSGFFSIATNRGKALLYRLQHYADF
ncbi:U3 small nucleolar RNA-associated protein 18 homolog [Hemiscyllium ocellatum]|uniref:U3 small nucleolar RNA-associated protein 18 homolog n=1 Tax=Hemiscyllium ocellatum TaxID=170820 RepID=UPI0029661869|nr:U3 small nucleolar RNA-associated protein 18 homolog [Hemiscyllium ocellatum]XP_060700409.1 U3 small nucleolar RNA-associated protein 18 homolog [Hemiscyllium ocellatum]